MIVEPKSKKINSFGTKNHENSCLNPEIMKNHNM